MSEKILRRRSSKRPPAVRRRITAEWQSLVRDALVARGRDQKWLAGIAGCSEARISALLRAERVGDTSKFVDAIGAELNIPPPEYADEIEARFAELGRLVRAHDPRTFDRVFKSLSRAAEKIRTPLG